jgi:single-strand DNA-binding protein
MAGINRVVLIGRLVRDPELKRTGSGTSVTSFTVAVDNMPRAGGEKSASFIPCTCWTKTAENVAKYCTKGSLVGIDGRLNQRSYTDKSGNKHSVVEVVADSVQFLDKKGTSGSGENAPTDASPAENGNDSNLPAHEGIDSSDDQLPF